MTQQTTQGNYQNAQVIPSVMLPYEITRAVLESSGALASIESVTSGSLSGVDTQEERTDLISQIRGYFESGAINAGGLIIGVLFLIAGVYLLFLEFKESPKSADVKRVARDVSARAKTRKGG